MGFWALGIVVAPIMGPVLGGWLTDNYSWRWVFYINIPVGIASIVMTKLYIFDPSYLRIESRKIDYWGIGMLAGRHRRTADRPRQGAGGRLVLFEPDHHARDHQRRHARCADHPPADDEGTGRRSPRLQGTQLCRRRVPDDDRRIRALRQHGAAADHAADACSATPPLQAGIAMAPRGIGSFFHDADHRAHDRGGSNPRKLLTVGLFVGGMTLVWLSRLNLQAGYWDIFWPQLIQGVGMSLLFVPLTTVAMDPIRSRRWATRPASST
jgi:DHA2 family multidrug resistance protein